MTFSESVSNVVAGDFGLATSGTGGTAPVISTVTGSGATYTVTVTTTGTTGTNAGSIGVNLTSVGTNQDTAGNALNATPPVVGQAYTFDTSAPTGVTIASAPSPQDGKPNASDQIIYTFSEPISANSIKSGWNGLSTSVTVHFDNDGNVGNSGLTVTGVNLGNVDLGDTGTKYVSNHGSRFDLTGTMVMTTNGSNQSVVTIALTQNGSAQVTANTTWKWVPSTATDLAGNTVSTTLVTELAAKENF